MDIIETAGRMRALAREIRNQSREDFPMQAYLYRDDGSKLLVQGLDEGLTPGQRGAVLRSLIAQHKAVAVVLIYEAWSARQPPEASRSDLSADLSTVPGAEELMVCTVETVTFIRRWVAPIAAGLVGDFIESPLASPSGPMANLLYVEAVN